MVSDTHLIYFLIGKDNYYHDACEWDSACVNKNKRKALVGISIIAKTPLFMRDKCARVDNSEQTHDQTHLTKMKGDVFQVMLNTLQRINGISSCIFGKKIISYRLQFIHLASVKLFLKIQLFMVCIFENTTFRGISLAYICSVDAKVLAHIVCFSHLIIGFLLDNEFKWNKIAFAL